MTIGTSIVIFLFRSQALAFMEGLQRFAHHIFMDNGAIIVLFQSIVMKDRYP